MSDARITVCICTYNRYDRLPGAIESALQQTLDRSLYRILVVDNSPDHLQAEAFGAPYRQPGLLDYHVEHTPGLSNARNVGARNCGTEFIAFMDDDAIAEPGWLGHVLDAFDRFGANAAVVGGRVEPMWEVPRPSWLGDKLLGWVSVVDWGGDLRVALPTEWLAGTNISFRTATILDSGGFDVKLGRKGDGATLMSNEEVIIVNHLRDQGLDSVYAPLARVRHLVERKRLHRAWFRKRVVWQAVSDYTADPQAAAAIGLKNWAWAMGYFFQLPAMQRTVRGLYYDTDSAELLRHQLDALYLFTLMQLAGFEGVAAQDRDALGV